MEQDKLPCTPPDSPDYPCDREVFERAAALIGAEMPAVRYHLRTPPFWDGLPGSYLQAFGMVKWYNSELEAAWRNERKGYMGLGFD